MMNLFQRRKKPSKRIVSEFRFQHNATEVLILQVFGGFFLKEPRQYRKCVTKVGALAKIDSLNARDTRRRSTRRQR